MDLFDRELDIGDDRFETPRTYHSATKSYRSKQSMTPRSSNSDEYKTVSSRSSAFHTDNADYKSRPNNSDAEFHSAPGSVNGDYKKQYQRPPRKESDSVSDSSYNDTDVTDIFSFARHGRCDDIIRSLSRGVPVDIRDDVGNTMLIVACQNGNKRVIKAVLRNGANVNIKNYKGNTPLHYCYHCKSTDALIDHSR
jgi:ankyrin repeat protein